MCGQSVSGFGRDYEHVISKRVAQTLAGARPLPRMGRELTITEVQSRAVGVDAMGSALGIDFIEKLWLANVSGTFVLTCHSSEKAAWPELFSPAPEYKQLVSCGVFPRPSKQLTPAT